MSKTKVSSCKNYVTEVSVDGIRQETLRRKTRFMFVISVTWLDERRYKILKDYKDFFDLQCSILDEFPVASGKYNNERIIPYLPGRKVFKRNNVNLANERKPLLDNYVKKLVSLEPFISHSRLVLEFFQQGIIEEHGDIEQFNVVKDSDTEILDASSQDCLCYVNSSCEPEINDPCV